MINNSIIDIHVRHLHVMMMDARIITWSHNHGQSYRHMDWLPAIASLVFLCSRRRFAHARTSGWKKLLSVLLKKRSRRLEESACSYSSAWTIISSLSSCLAKSASMLEPSSYSSHRFFISWLMPSHCKSARILSSASYIASIYKYRVRWHEQ